MATQYNDRFSEAEEELSEKSGYVCPSCDTYYSKQKNKKRVIAASEGHLDPKYKDRFSQASEELSEKSGYVCVSCNANHGM